MDTDFPLLVYVIAWTAAFLGGLVDSIAGGGGIITVPVLLSMGIPPHLTLGTNKLQASFGSLTAAVNYTREGLVDIRKVIPGILLTATGSMIGTLTIQMLSPDFLKRFIPVLLVFIFLYLMFSPDFGKQTRRKILSDRYLFGIFGLLIGWYDGFFGPGTGSFWAMVFVLLGGLNLKQATGHTKVMNFTSNFVSLVTFFMSGLVIFKIGLVMGVGQLTGARLGSQLVIRHEVKFVRYVLMAVIAVTIAKLVLSTYF